MLWIKERSYTCSWCYREVHNKRPNMYYKAMYGRWYDPNDNELGRVISECVCDSCWNVSILSSSQTS